MEQAPPTPSSGLGFEGGTAYLLARAGAAARRQWARMLSERDLTPHHHGVLMALAELGPMGQLRLSEAIGVDARNAVQVIEGLVGRDLLLRETDATDRRRRVLDLTPAGRDLVGELTTTGAELERDFFRALDADAQQDLHRMLVALLADDGTAKQTDPASGPRKSIAPLSD